jgi:hypothetical protein
MYEIALPFRLACGMAYPVAHAQTKTAKVVGEAERAHRDPEEVKKAPAAVRKTCRDEFGLPDASDPTHRGSPEITECTRAGGPGER